ncbi:MAG: alpha-amylase family glycosyl hydrolase [Flavobacteriaceae bacterium]
MKKTAILLIAILSLVSCKKEKETPIIEETTTEEVVQIQPINDDILETAVIYEANIRQYSEEGSFNAFTKDIPQLKQLGVKVIWLMPIFPISETKRKATGGDFAHLIEDEAERAKMLGSYYAVTDYTKVNPEFGNIDDFRELVKTAHNNGIYVILDWVPNHTGWDHIWIKEKPDYYTQNEKGEIIDPTNPETGESWGWADVADLNYDNQEMRKEMIEDMKYWITEEGVDGFRCDVAGAVPQDFWEQAIPELRKQKDIFMLAEAWEPELMKGKGLFDMAYGWGTHHRMNEMAQGKDDVSAWDNRMKEISEQYEADDILMNFITNHDENSWNGTIEERMGKAADAMLALSYVAPGMPLIYSGQEYGLNHRLKFFEKDQIPKTKGNVWNLLEKLGTLKNSNPALNGGKQAASYVRIDTNNDYVLAFKRSKDGKEVLYIGNFSNEKQNVTIPLKGSFTEYITNSKLELNNSTINLEPWGYKVLIN